MLITIPDVLNANELTLAREALNAAEWIDGKVTAGYQAQTVKENLQLPEGHPVAVKLGEMVLAALARSPLFSADMRRWSSALPGATSTLFVRSSCSRPASTSSSSSSGIGPGCGVAIRMCSGHPDGRGRSHGNRAPGETTSVDTGRSTMSTGLSIGRSRRTVATHVSHILKKLDVHSRTDITRESALRTIASR